MIDLTPLDVRKKREDFRRILRGYDPEEVDTFLELVAERMEELVKETLTLRERTDRLQEQVSSQLGRERAVQEALVTAQELRDEIRGQARQEAEEVVARAEKGAELVRKQAEAEAEGIVARAGRELERRGEALKELERKRMRFLRSFRALLEREMDVVEVEEGRAPLEDVAVELEFGGRSASPGPAEEAPPGRGAQESSGPGADEGGEPGAAAPAGPARDPVTADASTPPDASPSDEGLPPADLPAVDLPSPADLPSAPELPSPEGGEEDDPKRWLSSLVERELNEKSDDDPWS